MSLHITNAHTELPRCKSQITVVNHGVWTCQKHLNHEGDHGDLALGQSWPAEKKKVVPLKIEKLVFDGLPKYLAEEERRLIVDDVVRLLRLNGSSYWMSEDFNLYVCNGILATRPVLVLDDPQ